MWDIIPIYHIATTLVALNGFQKVATWRFLDPETEYKEPENEDPSLIDTTQRYRNKEGKKSSRYEVKII